MITNAQKALFDTLYGYDEENQEEGTEIATILETRLIMPKSIILYLNKAITEECQTFLVSLDYLYDHCRALGDAHQQSALELIHALKRLNDICFNNEMKDDRQVDSLGEPVSYGVMPTLNHVFGRLSEEAGLEDGKSAAISAQDAKAFQDMMREAVGHAIERLRKKPEQYDTGWRSLVGLPSAQMPIELIVNSEFEHSWQAQPSPLLLGRTLNPLVQARHAQQASVALSPDDRLPPHYTDQVLSSPAIAEVIYRKLGCLIYGLRALDLVPENTEMPSTYPGALLICTRRLLSEAGQQGEYLVAHAPEGAHITTLPDYLRDATLEKQQKLAQTTKEFLVQLLEWEQLNLEGYLPIEPRLLIVEQSEEADTVTLRRLSFERSEAFVQYELAMTVSYSPLSVMLLPMEIALRRERRRVSSALTLGMSLFFSIFSEEEIFTALTAHLRRPINSQTLNAFDLMMHPLIGSTTIQQLIDAKVIAGSLHIHLATLMRAMLHVDPIERETHIQAFLSESMRPQLTA